MNREKRDKIKTLTNVINELKKNQINNNDLVNKSIRSSMEVLEDTACENCKQLQSNLINKDKELSNQNEAFIKAIEELKSENSAIKTNMTDLIKDFDKEKIRVIEKQNENMLKFIDDAKERLRQELTQVHEDEKQNLQKQIAEINGELLYTKEEYVKLCSEMKSQEDQIRKEINHTKRT